MSKETFNLEYPVNLLADIFGLTTEEQAKEYASQIEDLQASIEYAINQHLSPIERKIIILRYADKASIKEITEKQSITDACIRAHIKTACNKMQELDIVRFGINEALKRRTLDVYKTATDFFAKLMMEYTNELHKNAKIEIAKEIPVSCFLGQSVCIRLADIGVNTIFDLSLKTRDELQSIRGLSATKNSIVSRILNAFDLCFNGEENTNHYLYKEIFSDTDETHYIKARAAVAKSININTLGLDIRAANCVKRGRIENLFDLSEHTLQSLGRIRGLGYKQLVEIVSKANALGFYLKGQDTNKTIKEQLNNKEHRKKV